MVLNVTILTKLTITRQNHWKCLYTEFHAGLINIRDRETEINSRRTEL